MRNGLLVLSLFFACTASTATAQQITSPYFPIGVEQQPWQPPNSAAEPRPEKGPGGYRFYGNVDYLMWWSERDHPLTTLTADPLAHPVNAVLADATDFGGLLHYGGRAVLGTWLTQQQNLSMEIGGFWTLDRSPHREAGAEDVAAHTQWHSEIWGADATLRAELFRGTWVHVDCLTGFRFLNFDESLGIAEHDLVTDAVTSDRFGTRNRFYGGNLGAEMEWHSEKCFIDVWGKVALGATCETANFNGTTIASGQATPGGIIATSNQVHRNEFAVLPEFGINFGYHLTQHLRVMAGYTFLFLSEVARPAEQVETLVHTPQASPFLIQSSDVWLQGLNLGLEFRF